MLKDKIAGPCVQAIGPIPTGTDLLDRLSYQKTPVGFDARQRLEASAGPSNLNSGNHRLRPQADHQTNRMVSQWLLLSEVFRRIVGA
jgi:hypothetical protein